MYPGWDINQRASILHFERLFNCYGNDICILNLVKSNEKSSESSLGNAYKNFFDNYSNQLWIKHKEWRLRFKWFDFFSIYNKSEKSLIKEIQLYGKNLTPSLGILHYDMFEGIISW